MLLLFVATVYMIIASKNPLKKYLLTGSLILLLGSVISLVLYSFVGSSELKCYAHPIVFTALLIENIIFSLALGKKQRTILEDKILYEKQLNEERLNLLRSNLNPHFIFNVLNSIKSSIIESDVKKSVQSLNLFAKLMRIFLNSTQESEHSLKKEIELLEIYLKAENIRYEEPLDFEIENNLTINIEKIFLPSMILQPFIENIIKHGFTFTTKNKQILMSLNNDDSFLIISLLDNGKGLKEKFAYRNKSSLFITKKRIEFFATKNTSISSISIQNRKNQKGVVVEIKMPLLIKGNQ